MKQVAIADLCWGVPGQADIVKDVALTIHPGEVFGLLGPNGSGKTSLLRCLYRVNRPNRGCILVGPDDIWRLSARRAARLVAAVLQENDADFHLDVRAVVEMGRLPYRRLLPLQDPRCRNAVDKALTDLDLLTLAGRSFASLSGGERQRVRVARALAQDPAVLVLDEPTNHLDIQYQLDLMERIGGLGLTVVTALHDLNLAARYCDRVAVLKGGRVVRVGSPGEVLNRYLIAETFRVDAEIQDSRRHCRPQITFHPLLTSKSTTRTDTDATREHALDHSAAGLATTGKGLGRRSYPCRKLREKPYLRSTAGTGRRA